MDSFFFFFIHLLSTDSILAGLTDRRDVPMMMIRQFCIVTSLLVARPQLGTRSPACAIEPVPVLCVIMENTSVQMTASKSIYQYKYAKRGEAWSGRGVREE